MPRIIILRQTIKVLSEVTYITIKAYNVCSKKKIKAYNVLRLRKDYRISQIL